MHVVTGMDVNRQVNIAIPGKIRKRHYGYYRTAATNEDCRLCTSTILI